MVSQLIRFANNLNGGKYCFSSYLTEECSGKLCKVSIYYYHNCGMMGISSHSP